MVSSDVNPSMPQEVYMRPTLLRILASGILLFAAFPALAEGAVNGAPSTGPNWFNLVITALGSLVAIQPALEAFARPVQIANAPTFPKYMTSPQQYWTASWVFAIFACCFFFLLVYEHRQVAVVASAYAAATSGLPEAVKDGFQAIMDDTAPFLLIVVIMGGLYWYLLTKEAPWNVLLIVRDTIRSWISVPGLAKDIVERIQSTLRVPADAMAEVSANSEGVGEQDFHKDRNTPDRQWAETCYMKWWLTPRQESGNDATFFKEESYGFGDLVREFRLTALAMRACKSRDDAAPPLAEVAVTVKDLHEKFSRLIACYLIYRNASKQNLCAQARKFGIDMSVNEAENPLRYWIMYVIALAFAVYVGVYASAIGYDWFVFGVLNPVQDPGRALTWVLYSLTNYGLAIILILLIRLVIPSGASRLITYCWTFLAAFVVGPLGLTVAVHYFGPDRLREMTLLDLYFNMLKWGFGPALVCVYISYHLDLQTCGDLRAIKQSYSTVGWRLLNCLGFAAITVFLLLPPLLSMQAQEGAWDSAKLRFVGTGTTFFIAFGMALTAQFLKELMHWLQAVGQRHDGANGALRPI
jgi:hypothetical protein